MRLLTIAAAVLLATTSAAAQDTSGQTPENAQAFLTKVVAAGGIVVQGKHPNLDYGWSPRSAGDGPLSAGFAPGQLASATAGANAAGPCLTVLKAQAAFGHRDGRSGAWGIALNPLFNIWTSEQGYPDPQSPNYTGVVEATRTLDWSTVVSVNVNGQVVTLPNKSSVAGVQLTLPTSDLAKRVGFAMEVIRLACDSTADANF